MTKSIDGDDGRKGRKEALDSSASGSGARADVTWSELLPFRGHKRVLALRTWLLPRAYHVRLIFGGVYALQVKLEKGTISEL